MYRLAYIGRPGFINAENLEGLLFRMNEFFIKKMHWQNSYHLCAKNLAL